MPWISAGIGIGGSILSSNAQSGAAGAASDIQAYAAAASAAEQQRQFDTMVNLLSPYTQAGAGAIGKQQGLLGLKGDAAQQAALEDLKQSAIFNTLQQQGTSAINQNKIATGGIRGGNIADAMSQFSPQMLSDLYQSQLANLGGLSSLGQASSVMQAQQGQSSPTNIANLLAQQGAAQAGGILSKSAINQNLYNNLAQIGGMVAPSIMSGYSGGSIGEYFPSNSHVTPRQNW